MMKLPAIPLFKLDLSGNNPDNKVTREYYSRKVGTKNPIVVMRQGPFYHNNFELHKPNGELLVKGKDYEFYGLAKHITKYVKDKPVSAFIKLLDTNISEFYATYQVVGNFSLVGIDLLDHIQSALDDDRPVYIWDIIDLPKWFPPELHKHDIRYQIHSLQDLIEQIKRINDVKNVLPNRNLVEIDHFYDTISYYIKNFKEQLTKIINDHDQENNEPYSNDHGLTAKQVELEKVDNFETATYEQILEGLRRDLHVTADLAKKAIDSYSKESDNLFKKGLLPLMRYGSNNFIPPSIDGSFEGMGGLDFNTGMGKEGDGVYLILTPRRDGRGEGLYFLRNTSENIDFDKWEFTAYKYEHSKAISDGVKLTKIIRGSNQKFLIVGNGTRWYWTYGNGTFNPDKHELHEIPSWSKGLNTPKIVNEYSYVITEAYPKKIYVLTQLTASEVWNDSEWKPIGFSGYPSNHNEDLSPVEITNNPMQGFLMWELDVSTNTWRKIKFNYQQCGETKRISNYMFSPYLYKLEKGYPRKDFTDYSQVWSLKQGRFKYSYGINFWFERWQYTPICKYDKINNRLAFKYFSCGYGKDSRNGLKDSSIMSFGISLENFSFSGNDITCEVVNGYGMTKMYDFDTSPIQNYAPSNMNDTIGGEWTGNRSHGVIKDGVIYGYGTLGYGTLPGEMTKMDLRNSASWENYDLFYTTRFNPLTNPTSYKYNEVNPVGLSVGMNSAFYLLPDVNNPNSYGAIGTLEYPKCKSNLIYRRLDALDSNKNFKAPNTNYTLFNTSVKGYPLSNNVKPVICDFFYNFTTVILNNNSQQKDRYLKRFIGYSSYKEGETLQRSDNVNFKYIQEAEFVDNGSQLNLNILKRVDLEKVIKGDIFNSLNSFVRANHPTVSIENYLATVAATPVHLANSSHENLLIFTCQGIKDNGECIMFAIAFKIINYTSLSGVDYEASNIQLIGNWSAITILTVRGDMIDIYRSYNASLDMRKIIGENISPRNLVMQTSNNSAIVIYNSHFGYQVTGDYLRTGAIFLVDNNGIKRMDNYTNYRTSGAYTYFYHPYYGIVRRTAEVGASQIGKIYDVINKSETDMYNNFVNNVLRNEYVLGFNNYIEGAFTIYFKSSEKVIVGGNEYTLNSGYIDLNDIISNPANRTFYIYLSYSSNNIQYKVSLSPLAETYANSLIATVKTNNDGIYSIERFNVFTMNGFRIGSVRHGSTIPKATGTIKRYGQTTGWADNSADLS